MVRYRYSRWNGSQVDTLPEDGGEAIGHIFSHLLECGDVVEALRRALRSGTTGVRDERIVGLDEMLERLQALKQDILRRYDIASVVERLDSTLRDIVDRERCFYTKKLWSVF